MRLRTRFTLYFALLFVGVLGLFSTLVYRQVQRNLLTNAERSLLAHIEHDAQHLGHRHGALHAPSDAQHVYLRVWEEGQLVEDSFPVRLAPPGTDLERILRTMKITREGKHYELVGYYDLRPTNAYLATLRNVLLLGCLFALLVVIPFGLVSTTVLLSPFRKLAQKTSQLDAEHLSYRFPLPKRHDEYGALVTNFNLLLDRLEGSFAQMKRFATNASHELRTPLAVIIGQAEMALRRPRTVEEHREVTGKVLEQAKHLRSLTNRLLTIADLERAASEGVKADISVDKTLQDVVETLSFAYRASPRNIVVRGNDKPISFRGNEEVLRSIFSNVLENAVKYSRENVAVELAQSPGELRMRIEDDGPGIPEEQRGRVFEPFTKLPTSPPTPESHGLGLAIVKACVDTCRGVIRLDRSPLGGLSVDIQLPESA